MSEEEVSGFRRIAHEFGHSLGLPDLYDLNYDDPERDSAGVGRTAGMGTTVLLHFAPGAWSSWVVMARGGQTT